MAQKLPKTVGDSERKRLVALVAGVLAGVYAAGLLDGLLTISRFTSPEPRIDVLVSLMMHMAAGVAVLPVAAVAAYGWMPLRWWLKNDWRPPSKWVFALWATGSLVAFGSLGAVFVWKRGIEVSAIDPTPLVMPVVGCIFGWAIYRIAMEIGQWLIFVPLVLAAIGLIAWFSSDLDRTGSSIERLAFNGLSSKVFSKQLHKAVDGDGDGFPRLFCDETCDCQDADAEISPGAVESPGNGIDDDCIDGDLVIPQEPSIVQHPEPVPDEAVLKVGPTPAPDLERPNVLLITIDTLRSDHMGMYGYARDTTPRMDALAREGVVFERARSQGPMTCFSVPVLITGRYYSELVRTKSKWPQMHESNVMMAEMLLSAGYHTAAFHSIGYFVPLFQFDQGFNYYDASAVYERAPTHWHPTSDLITDKTLAYFDSTISRQPADKPWFVWAYYGDPHSGYIRHKDMPDFGPTYPDIYDQEIYYTDYHIGRLLDGLRERQELLTAVVLITSDHGEGLDKSKDHGLLYHGQTLFDNLLKVPLIFWGAGIEPGRVKKVVGNIDVLPTLLELTGAKVPEGHVLRGGSLVPFLKGRDPDWPPLFAEKTIEQGIPEKAMIKWPWKIIWMMGVNRFTLYNLEEDPDELREASADNPEIFAAMKREIQVWRATVLQERPPSR